MGGFNTAKRARLGFEALETREVPSVTAAGVSGGVLNVYTDNAHNQVRVSRAGGVVTVRDQTTGQQWGFWAGFVGQVNVTTGSGNDRIDASALGTIPMLARTGAGSDTVYGGAGRDTVYAGTGNDVVYGVGGDDRLYGEAGNDTVSGGYGNDFVGGGAGDDRVYGGDGHDTVFGGTGADYLSGGAGSDRLDAGDGSYSDTLVGGAGSDTFRADRLRILFVTLNSDKIVDKTAADSIIWV
ncbi:MAG: hypothetical protein K2X82_10955 [Gemmataceae bacterium]|nr:hypothetical protein [Gemmataceae bacterium]